MTSNELKLLQMGRPIRTGSQVDRASLKRARITFSQNILLLRGFSRNLKAHQRREALLVGTPPERRRHSWPYLGRPESTSANGSIRTVDLGIIGRVQEERESPGKCGIEGKASNHIFMVRAHQTKINIRQAQNVLTRSQKASKRRRGKTQVHS